MRLFISSITSAGRFLSCALIDHRLRTCVLSHIQSETCLWCPLSMLINPQTHTPHMCGVEFVVNQGTTQELARRSNWTDKKTHSNLFYLKSDRQKRCENRIFLYICTKTNFPGTGLNVTEHCHLHLVNNYISSKKRYSVM